MLAPLESQNTTWSWALRPPCSRWNSPGIRLVPPSVTRKRPDMPRCMTRTSPEDRSASRYLARRPSAVTSCPSRRSANRSGKGKRRSGRRCTTLVKRAPTMAGSRPRRAVSTSGSSGINHLLVLEPLLHSHPAPLPLWIASRSDERFFKAMSDDKTHFGFRSVPLGEKQGRVSGVFRSVAGRYDLMNDLMAAVLHRLWKDALVSTLRPPRDRPFRHLDVAGGTGDVAFRILDESGPQTRVTVLDINGEMLKVGAERAGHRYEGRIDFVEANAEELPLEAKSYDAYTIAFGIRNVPRIDAALREAHRVLKPGGRFLCLEFSKVDVPVLDKIYDAYSFNVIPRLGQVVAGDAESYQYLVESIRRFPPPAAFARMIEEAGFRRVTHRSLTGGIVAIHSGWKI